MPSDALEQVLDRLLQHRFVYQIPAPLRPWLLPIDWDRDRLWDLDLPRQGIRLELLRWHLALPWWRYDGVWFRLTAHEVLARPSAYPEHAERIASADLSYPLHVVRRRHRWLILDGIHRLAKADLLGYTEVQAVTLTTEDVAAIARHAA